MSHHHSIEASWQEYMSEFCIGECGLAKGEKLRLLRLPVFCLRRRKEEGSDAEGTGWEEKVPGYLRSAGKAGHCPR